MDDSNLNFRGGGGAVFWSGANGTLSHSNFINNSAICNSTSIICLGGAVYWNGTGGKLFNSNFRDNTASYGGGGILWDSINGILTNSTFINNVGGRYGGGLHLTGFASNITVSYCKFIKNMVNLNGGGICWAGKNGVLTSSIFTDNVADEGGAIYINPGTNGACSLIDCNFTNNHAFKGKNIAWYLLVDEFLNKYHQFNDFDYVYIRNGVGTPNSTIVLNKKDITISSGGNVVFDAKGKNLHFEVTGDNVLIEKITFRNFNFTNMGGAIYWTGNNGALTNCNFINNTANDNGGGAIRWNGNNGIVSNSAFTNNTAINHGGGGIYWIGVNGTLTSSTFTNNKVNWSGGGVRWAGDNGIITDCTFKDNTADNAGGLYFTSNTNDCILSNSIFINNTANYAGGAVDNDCTNSTILSCTFINNIANDGGAVFWPAVNGTLIGCTFTGNIARSGGGIRWNGFNATLIGSTFTNNTATYAGGAIYWIIADPIINCDFINNKWINETTKSNGIYAEKDLIINGGNGIVEIVTQGTLSGTSIVVLNNETYYYPPNTNINFFKKHDLFDYILVSLVHFILINDFFLEIMVIFC